MQLPGTDFTDVEKMIRHLEKSIRDKTVTPKLLASLQKRLDDIDNSFRYDSDVEPRYHQLLELQALIYVQEKKATQAERFLTEAVDRAGGVSQLTSTVLRSYARKDESFLSFDQLNDKERKFLASYNITESTEITFFTKSPTAFVFLSLLTLGIYNIYWFSKNWTAVRNATGQKMWPFWRAIFVVFWAWPLFKIVMLSARVRGYQKPFSAGWMAFWYIFLGFCDRSLSRSPQYDINYYIGSFVLELVSVIILARIQGPMLYNNQRVGTSETSYQKVTKWEIFWLVLGAVTVIWLGAVFVKAGTPPSPAQQAKITQAKQTYDSLTQQYDTCSSALLARKPSVDLNDTIATDSYNSDYDMCEQVRQQQNSATDTYNMLLKQ